MTVLVSQTPIVLWRMMLLRITMWTRRDGVDGDRGRGEVADPAVERVAPDVVLLEGVADDLVAVDVFSTGVVGVQGHSGESVVGHIVVLDLIVVGAATRAGAEDADAASDTASAVLGLRLRGSISNRGVAKDDVVVDAPQIGVATGDRQRAIRIDDEADRVAAVAGKHDPPLGRVRVDDVVLDQVVRVRGVVVCEENAVGVVVGDPVSPTTEFSTPFKWMPPPQSPGYLQLPSAKPSSSSQACTCSIISFLSTGLDGGNSPKSAAESIPTRSPSPLALISRNPRTFTSEATIWIAFSRPVASIVAP